MQAKSKSKSKSKTLICSICNGSRSKSKAWVLDKNANVFVHEECYEKKYEKKYIFSEMKPIYVEG